MKRATFLMLIAAIALITFSCNKEDDGNNNGSKSTLKILLTDAPATYNAVNVDIQSVGVCVDSTWFYFDLETPGIYDLISLSNGTSALLVSNVTVPSGIITQMRLFLGDSNSIVVDSVTYDLKTPSAQTSGYKVKINAPISAGATYQVLLDFDAARSIVEQGNGKYLLKPVVTGSLLENIGQLDGTVVPSIGGTVAQAWNATDTFSVFIDQATGFFLINSLEPGSYSVKITAVTPYLDTTFTNVPVTAGQVTHLDSIFLAQ